MPRYKVARARASQHWIVLSRGICLFKSPVWEEALGDALSRANSDALRAAFFEGWNQGFGETQ